MKVKKNNTKAALPFAPKNIKRQLLYISIKFDSYRPGIPSVKPPAHAGNNNNINIILLEHQLLVVSFWFLSSCNCWVLGVTLTKTLGGWGRGDRFLSHVGHRWLLPLAAGNGAQSPPAPALYLGHFLPHREDLAFLNCFLASFSKIFQALRLQVPAPRGLINHEAL